MNGHEIGRPELRELLELELRTKSPLVMGLRATRLFAKAPTQALAKLRGEGFVIDAFTYDQIGGQSSAPVDIVVVQDDVDFTMLLRSLDLLGEEVCIVDARENLQPWSRIEWEQLFIEAGWRKHPCRDRVSPYPLLDKRETIQWSWFLRIAPDVLESYPLSALKEERDLHMDMTRESGRRSDAHLARYSLAAQFIRDGDAVLDLACGLGYGADVLDANAFPSSILGMDNSSYAVDYANLNFGSGDSRSTFALGSAESVNDVDGPFEFVTSIETLEHLIDPTSWLRTVFGKLSPGGRLFVSVPLNWADETGEDPNPYHYHVYFWPILRDQLETAGFVVERVWMQDAGGGFKRHDAERDIREVSYEEAGQVDGEWILALAIKPSPGISDKRPTALDHTHSTSNILAFERDYNDGSIVRSLVSVGLRASSHRALGLLARRVLHDSDPNSADYGAALCVLAYQSLNADDFVVDNLLEFEVLIADYVEQDSENPTIFRWKVSLMYVLALLRHVAGQYDLALEAYGWVEAQRVEKFSPLLGTKTMQAIFRKGALQYRIGLRDEAVQTWHSAVPRAQALVDKCDWNEIVGGGETHTTFGLPELAEVLDVASKSVHALHVTEMGGIRKSPPALDRLQSSSADRIRLLQQQGIVERSHVRALEAAIAWLDSQRQNWMSVSEQRDQSSNESIGWMKGHIERLEEELNKAVLVDQELRGYIERRNNDIEALVAESSSTRDITTWLEQQRLGLLEALDSQKAVASELESQLTQKVEANQWLELQRISLLKEIDGLKALSETLESQLTQKDEANKWLETQRKNLLKEAEGLKLIADSLRANVEASRRDGEWQEEQRSGLLTQLSAAEDVVSSLKDMLKEREGEAQWLEAQRLSLLDALDKQNKKAGILISELTASRDQVVLMSSDIEKFKAQLLAHDSFMNQLRSNWLGRMVLRRARNRQSAVNQDMN